jgi:serine protease AprX
VPASTALPSAATALRLGSRRSAAVAVLLAAVAVLLMGGLPPAASGASQTGAPLSAVVALSGDQAVRAPGVDLVRMLPSVGVEIVRGSRAALAGLAHVAGVLGVTPNLPVHLQAKAYAGAPIYAPQTLSIPPVADAGTGVNVAVIDTGVSDTATLERGTGRLVDGVDTSGLSNPNGTIQETGTFADGYGHGTYVASLIAGGSVSAGGGQIVGVAPGATVTVVKVADDHGRTSLASVVAGLDWVATHAQHDEIRVANLSLSVARPSDAYGADPLNIAVQRTRAQGVTVVVAAGNTAGVVSDPGFDPSALTVGAYDTTTDGVASFSGSDPSIGKPDLVAAGVHVTGEVPADSIVGRSNKPVSRSDGEGNLLIPGTGTSGATAIVSGLAADFLSTHPSATPDDVVASMRAAATSVSGSPGGLAQLPTTVTQGTAPDYPDGWDATKAGWPDEFWQDDLWTQPWTAATWNTRTWSTRTWSTRTWSTRTWSTRTWTTRTWTTRTWTEDMWSVSGWGS